MNEAIQTITFLLQSIQQKDKQVEQLQAELAKIGQPPTSTTAPPAQ